jgi:hypothetical protein
MPLVAHDLAGTTTVAFAWTVSGCVKVMLSGVTVIGKLAAHLPVSFTVIVINGGFVTVTLKSKVTEDPELAVTVAFWFIGVMELSISVGTNCVGLGGTVGPGTAPVAIVEMNSTEKSANARDTFGNMIENDVSELFKSCCPFH